MPGGTLPSSATQSTPWLLRYRLVLYLLLVLGSLVALPAGATLHGVPMGRVVYAWLLLAICAAPALLMQSFSSRYVLLLIFTGTYLIHFGGVDIQAMLLGEDTPPERTGFLMPAELVVLSGAVLACLGYLAGMRLVRAPDARRAPAQWPRFTILVGGVALWLAGTAAIIYFGVFVAPSKTNLSSAEGMAAMGPMLTFIVMLGHLLQPLGLLVIAYGYARFRGLFWTGLTLVIAFGQAAAAFIVDIKTLALLTGIVVIVVWTLVNNRIPKAWMAGSLVFVAVMFPMYQAYRAEITGERGLNRLQALQQIGRVIEVAWADRHKAMETEGSQQRSATLLERAYLKGNLETVIEHAGVDVPFLNGSSLVALPMAFVPRLLDPDKLTIAVGQLYTHDIMHSEDDTNISISHLGEMYWNFGWPGVVGGMTLAGLILGMVGAKTDLEAGVSLTRVMVLVATVQYLCIDFEGEIPTSYVNWMRSLAAIGLMHLMLARKSGQALPVSGGREGRDADARMLGWETAVAGAHASPAGPVSGQVRPAKYPNILH